MHNRLGRKDVSVSRHFGGKWDSRSAVYRGFTVKKNMKRTYKKEKETKWKERKRLHHGSGG
jgi:hypothetical protein